MPTLNAERSTLDRRLLLRSATLGLAGLALSSPILTHAQSELLDDLVIDLSSEPATLDPVLTYTADGWSIVHAIYDAPFQFDDRGNLQMLAAESLAYPDDTTLEVRLKPNQIFHDGTILTAESIKSAHDHLVASDSQIKGNFATISAVEMVDDLTALIRLSSPSPWLPAQIAAWLLCVSPAAVAAGTVVDNPVGSGPYRFVSWERGNEIVLEANPDYPITSLKGRPIARQVRYRFVGDASTRVADLLSGSSGLIRAVPVDQVASVTDGGSRVVTQPLSGNAWIRIPTDIEPFSDVRVRLAMNHAVDVQAIIDALLGGNGRPLANLFVPNGLGFDEALPPLAYDPDLARDLLSQAGVGDGFKTELAYATSERKDVLEAIAGMLGEVGIEVELVGQEDATFNGGWTDPEAPALRFATWRPMVDPFNLLNLVVSTPSATGGFLSRHSNPDAQALIDLAAVETDPDTRAATYRQLGRFLHGAPAAIYLWDLTALYGVSEAAASWTPRPDDYIIPTSRP